MKKAKATLIDTIEQLTIENQGLKLAIERGNGGNCIIAPKEIVNKIAKDRYINSLKYYKENAKKYSEYRDYVIVALKLAAGIE